MFYKLINLKICVIKEVIFMVKRYVLVGLLVITVGFINFLGCADQAQAEQEQVVPAHVGVQWHLSEARQERLWRKVTEYIPFGHVGSAYESDRVSCEEIENMVHTILRDPGISLSLIDDHVQKVLWCTFDQALRSGNIDLLKLCIARGLPAANSANINYSEAMFFPIALVYEDEQIISYLREHNFVLLQPETPDANDYRRCYKTEYIKTYQLGDLVLRYDLGALFLRAISLGDLDLVQKIIYQEGVAIVSVSNKALYGRKRTVLLHAFFATRVRHELFQLLLKHGTEELLESFDEYGLTIFDYFKFPEMGIGHAEKEKTKILLIEARDRYHREQHKQRKHAREESDEQACESTISKRMK